ncbi:nrag8 protein [Plakobranchus ocellatus]|uniref:Nrag8 protein n=1 Tax=Plakobranchus ocellatus TaxID=259542 RepID=A0AAV4BIJ9_9GAST|nr:nrag8 protein [Plakobranchus ocellatus]
MCNKCYFQLKNILKRHSAPSLLKARATYEEHKNKWCSFDETLKSDQCASCRHRARLTTGCLRRQSLCQPTLNNKKTSQTTHPSSCDRLVEKSNSTAARQTDQHENETSPITDSNYVEMTDTERLYESQRIAQTSMTIIDQLQQLTHSIIAETSTTSRDDSHHMTAPSETTIDNIQYIGSHNVPHSSQIHFTTPFIPIAESTPLKSSRTQKVTADTSTSPMFKHDKSFSQSLGLSENAPLSKEEEKLSTHLVRRKLNSDPGKQIIKCRTGGQPLVLQRVVAPRKHTTLVRTPTKRKRAKILHKVRSYVAGYSGESTDTQLATELKTLPTTRRQKIVLKAGVKQKLKISRHHTLAMKEALGMSWRQGKLLKKVDIHLDSQKSVRELSREIVSDFVQVEGRSFIKEDDSEYTAPYGRIAGLTKFVDHLLDSYKENNLLRGTMTQVQKTRFG